MQGFHNQTCSTTYWEKGSWQVFKQVQGKLTQTMLSKAFLEELKSKDRPKKKINGIELELPLVTLIKKLDMLCLINQPLL